MDIIQKELLAVMYSHYLKGGGSATLQQTISARLGLTFTNDIDSIIDKLIRMNLVNPDGTTLTDVGRSSLHIVLAGGVFDIIHPGHIHTLNAAKALGDVLVVVVATDTTAIKMKKRKPLHTQEQRRELVDSLSVVDVCLVGNDQDIFETVKIVWPETIALGYDQVHQEKFIMNGCIKIGLDAKVARLQSPIPDSSSSKITQEYGTSIHDI